MTLQRIKTARPGYDCVRTPCGKNGCGTNPGSSHGIYGGEWVYTVTDRETALSLLVLVNEYPATVPRRSIDADRPQRPGCIHFHRAFATKTEEILRPNKEEDCAFIDGGCFTDMAYLMAEQVWKQCGGFGVFDQSESFWRGLEAEWAKWTEDARKERVDLTHERCPRCDGSGMAVKELVHAAPAVAIPEES